MPRPDTRSPACCRFRRRPPTPTWRSRGGGDRRRRASSGRVLRKRSVLGKDQLLRSVLAAGRLFALADDSEAVHDMFDLLAVKPVEVEERSIELGCQCETPFRIPVERRSMVATGFGPRAQVLSRIDELQGLRPDPITDRGIRVPRARITKS